MVSSELQYIEELDAYYEEVSNAVITSHDVIENVQESSETNNFPSAESSVPSADDDISEI